MPSTFFHLRRPPRGRYYFSAGVGLVYWYLAVETSAPLYAAFGAAFFVAAMLWFGLRQRPNGMRIDAEGWHFFVGPREWSVDLRDIGAVRLLGTRARPQALALRFHDGRTALLPESLTPRIAPLEAALRRRGIPLET